MDLTVKWLPWQKVTGELYSLLWAEGLEDYFKNLGHNQTTLPLSEWDLLFDLLVAN